MSLDRAFAKQLADMQKQLMGLVKSQSKAMQQQQDSFITALERMWKGERSPRKRDALADSLGSSRKKRWHSRTFGTNY